MHVRAVLEFLRFYLAEWIIAALINVRLITICERLAGKDRVSLHVVGIRDAMIAVTRVNSFSCGICPALDRNGGQIVARYVSGFGLIVVMDGSGIGGVCDIGNLANASWRWRTANVSRGIIWITGTRAARVGDRIDVPVRIVAQPCGVILEIGVALEKLLRGGIISGVLGPSWTGFVGGPTKMKWCIGEPACDIPVPPACLGISGLEVRIKDDGRRRRRIDTRHSRTICAAVEAVSSLR